jgi:hypothetical protein
LYTRGWPIGQKHVVYVYSKEEGDEEEELEEDEEKEEISEHRQKLHIEGKR